MVALKDGMQRTMGYGRSTYDFSDGTMIFSKPNQVFSSSDKKSGKKF